MEKGKTKKKNELRKKGCKDISFINLLWKRKG